MKRRRVGVGDATHPSLVSDAFNYTPRTHRIFDRQGFIVLENVLTGAALDTLRSNVDAVLSEMRLGCDKNDGDGNGGRGRAAPSLELLHPEWIMSLHQVLPGGETNWMWQLATEPKLLDMLELHLGPDIVLFSTQLAVKPPKSGWHVPWHQDGERCRSVWIPLDDVDEENGALRMLSGWHRRGRQRFKPVATEEELASAEFFQQYHLYASDVDLASTGSAAVTCNMTAGGLEIHHPLTPHASAPNQSETRTRRAIIMRYQPASEPCIGGSLVHWKTGKAFTKANYLVRGSRTGGRAVAEAGVGAGGRPPFHPLPLP